MLDTFRKILGLPEYHQLNIIEISKENLISNYKYLSRLQKKVKIAPVLKSNAYGHGLTEVAKILDSVNAPFFCVDSLYEAYELLKENIKTEILIMGYIDPASLQIKQLPFSFAIWDLNQINALDKFQPGAGVHVFVDTGINREGIPVKELAEFLKILKQSNLKIEGLMSHLAMGDNPTDSLAKLQIHNFQKAIQICKENKIKPKYIHLQNSDGLLNLKVPECNIARVGLATYGITTSVIASPERAKQSNLELNLTKGKNPTRIASSRTPRNDNSLKPALQLKTKLIQIKSLQKGDRVGYDGTFTARKNMTLGILPIGYFDGVDRRLANKQSLRDKSLWGFVKLNGNFCKILGRISMNITTIDITEVKNARVGDEVIIFSNNSVDPNSIENSAMICKTIPYELLVHLASTTKRIIV